jgi:hypothetical protein
MSASIYSNLSRSLPVLLMLDCSPCTLLHLTARLCRAITSNSGPGSGST